MASGYDMYILSIRIIHPAFLYVRLLRRAYSSNYFPSINLRLCRLAWFVILPDPSASDCTMDTGNLDKELLAEMLSAMGKELKLARARIKEAEDEAKVSYHYRLSCRIFLSNGGSRIGRERPRGLGGICAGGHDAQL